MKSGSAMSSGVVVAFQVSCASSFLDRQVAENGEARQTGRVERETDPDSGTEHQGEHAENGAGSGDGHGLIPR